MRVSCNRIESERQPGSNIPSNKHSPTKHLGIQSVTPSNPSIYIDPSFNSTLAFCHVGYSKMYCLVSPATLPESSSLRRYAWTINVGAVRILMLGDAVASPVMESGRAASEKNDESAEEQADHSNEDGPNGR